MNTCTKCGETKPDSAFKKIQRKTMTSLSAHCILCSNAYTYAHRHKIPTDQIVFGGKDCADCGKTVAIITMTDGLCSKCNRAAEKVKKTRRVRLRLPRTPTNSYLYKQPGSLSTQRVDAVMESWQ